MIFAAIATNHYLPRDYRTLLMAFVTGLTVLGFALMRWLEPGNKAGRLIGYCTSIIR